MAQPSSEGRHLAPVSRPTSLLCCPLQGNVCHADLCRGFFRVRWTSPPPLPRECILNVLHNTFPPYKKGLHCKCLQSRRTFLLGSGGCSRALKHSGVPLSSPLLSLVKISGRQISRHSALNTPCRRVPRNFSLPLPTSQILNVHERHGDRGKNTGYDSLGLGQGY